MWTLQELTVLGEFIGVFGVIASVVYLAVQTRQNTKQLKSQSRLTVLDGLSHVTDELFEEDDFEFIWEVTQSAELSPKQKLRFRLLLTGAQSRHEQLFFEIAEGSLPESYRQILRYRIFSVFDVHDDIRTIWDEDVRNYSSKEFQAYVDDLLEGGLLSEFRTTVTRED